MKDQQALVAELVPFLLSRGYGPNERAPSERELAERFQASRPQIREALSVLEALRLIERRPKSGIYMTTESASIEALRLYAEIGVPLSGDLVGEIVEVRRIQEIEAIRLASRRQREENIADLRACLAEWTDALTDSARIAELDRVFHCGIVRAAQNTVLLRLVDLFYLMTERRRLFYFADPDRCRQSLREHEEILAALVDRDEERAVRLLDKHLSSASRYWDYLLNGTPPTPDGEPAAAPVP
ncbi:MAG TPA: FadR/GntR family transcriptional regulator [Pseudonocardia sp.]|nr:FadR/GntR family transcriptional regulator [Pseudonocardia sp.]